MSRSAHGRGYVSPFRLTASGLAVVVLGLGAMLLAIGLQVFLSRIFDRIGSGAGASLTLFVKLGLVALLSMVASMIFANYLPLFLQIKHSKSTILAAVDDLLFMPVQNYGRQRQGYFYNIMLGTALTMGTLYGHLSIELLIHVGSFLLLFGAAWWLQPFLAFGMLLYVPLVALVIYGPTKHMAQLQAAQMPMQDRALGLTKAYIERKRPITIAQAQEYFGQTFEEEQNNWLRFLLKTNCWDAIVEGLPGLVAGAFQICLLAVAAYFFCQGQMTAGGLLLTYQLAGLVQTPLTRIFEILSHYRVNKPHIERMREFCDLVEEPSGFEGKFTPSSYLASFEDAKLYANGEKERLLFDAPAMTLPQKGLVVIKGANGSGKSMLVNYLTGFGDASAFEGKSELNENLQKASYLTYPLLLTKGSFTDNLFGKGYDQEVAQMLGIDFFEKEIDDEKVNLSFGEGQKLNLLRVLSSPSPVIVLDEPFTNLDKETIARLTDYLLAQKEHKAIIAITHSPELDAGADAIYAIRDGQLVCEKG